MRRGGVGHRSSWHEKRRVGHRTSWHDRRIGSPVVLRMGETSHKQARRFGPIGRLGMRDGVGRLGHRRTITQASKEVPNHLPSSHERRSGLECTGVDGCYPTSKQASPQASKQAGKHPHKQASKQATPQASKQGRKQASKQPHKQASKHATPQASKQATPLSSSSS